MAQTEILTQELLEKELKEFSGGLPYDQARIIERTQDGFKQGVYGFYQAGLGLLLMERHEEARIFAEILEQHFPGISRSAAYSYMQFARVASKLPNFKAFCLERGGISKGLTMLQACTEAEIQEFDDTGELRSYTKDEIAKMSVRTLQKALLKAKEQAQHLMEKATGKLAQENSRLKDKVETLEAALSEPGVQEALKIIGAVQEKLLKVVELIRKIPQEVLKAEESVRSMVWGTVGLINRLTSDLEEMTDKANIEAQAAQAGDQD